MPCDGELLYRGYDVKELVKGSIGEKFIFEEAAYLLLFGKLPDQAELLRFHDMLAKSAELPTNFTRDVIMKAPSYDIMNSMTRSVLTLASYDEKAGNLELDNVLRQCIELISIFPMLDVLLLLHMEHGGVNIMVMQMMADIRKHVSDYSDEEEVRAYLEKILNKEAFDRRGLIYGMGHAVYLLEMKEE